MADQGVEMRGRIALAVLVSLLIVPVVPAPTRADDELTKLKQEVEALREGQRKLEFQLQEIKNLLHDRQAPRPPPRVELLAQPVAIAIDGAPVLGRPRARVALVEFSDYQCRAVEGTMPALRHGQLERSSRAAVPRVL